MLKSSFLVLAIASTTTGIAQADVAAIKFGANVWQPAFDGDVQDGLTTINLENDLGLDDEKATLLSLAIEHPIPSLPNVRIDYADLSIKASSTLTRSIDLDGINFSLSDSVSTEADLTHADAIFYYELLDNWVSIDLGVGVRLFDGFVQIQSTTDSAKVDLDEPLPLLYGAVQFDLPLTGLSVSAEAKGISYRGDSAIDYSAKVSYKFFLDLGIEAGYRGFKMDIDELGDFRADIDINGPYVGFNYHF